MRAKGYSLWLMPEGEVYKKLSGLIKNLAKKYSGPIFEPHVTLMGLMAKLEEEVLKKTEKLASLIKPYKISLTKVGFEDYFFRTLFVRVKKTDEVMEANRLARKIFSREEDPFYMPHLSLLYGDYPEELKKKIIQEIGSEFKEEFVTKSIFVYYTGGEVKDWYQVKEFPLIS